MRGDLKNADVAEIESALDGVGGNFFAADLGTVRARLEQVTWVRRVDLRRVWPDRIEVVLEEHVVFARWGTSGFVNTFGEPFSAALPESSAAQLPLFAGPATQVTALIARDKRLLRLELTLPPVLTTWRLAVQDAALANEWLQGKA